MKLAMDSVDDWLIEFQEEKWSNADYLSVEAVINTASTERLAGKTIVDLVCNEMRLRSELSETAEKKRLRSEMLQRFPALRDSLLRQFLLEDLLSQSSQRISVSPNRNQESDDTSGDLVVPGYRNLVRIAEGSSGVVYRGVQNGTEKEVAIKILGERHLDDRYQAEVMKAEARRLAVVDHPNIISVLETGECGGRPYYSMRFIAGGTLRVAMDRWNDHRTDVQSAIRLMSGIAAGVMAANANGVFHGDLKPSNILIDRGVPVVADFGLARRIRVNPDNLESTEVGGITLETFGGTPGYMAPEMYRLDSDGISAAAEVYSLGAILFEMLTGKLPSYSEPVSATTIELLKKCRVPRDVEDICRKCLAQDPQQRYLTVESLHEDLQNYIAKRPVNASRMTGVAHHSHRLGLWIQRAPVVVVLVSILALGGMMFVWSLRSRNSRLQNALRAINEQKHRQADGLFELGKLAAERGSLLQAEDVYRRTIDLYDGLLVESDSDPLIRKFRNHSRNNLSVVYRQLGRTTEAQDLLGEILADLPTAQLRSVEDWDIAGNAYGNLGNISADRREWETAEHNLLQSLASRERASDGEPEDDFRKLQVFRSELALCELCRQRNEIEEALLRYDALIPKMQEISEEHPHDIESFENLLLAMNNRAVLLDSMNRIPESQSAFEEVVDGYRKMLQSVTGSKIFRLRRFIASALVNLGRSHAKLGQLEKAEETYDAALQQQQILLMSPEVGVDIAMEYVIAIGNYASLGIQRHLTEGSNKIPDQKYFDSVQKGLQILNRIEAQKLQHPAITVQRFQLLDFKGSLSMMSGDFEAAKAAFADAEAIGSADSVGEITIEDRLMLALHQIELYLKADDYETAKHVAVTAIQVFNNTSTQQKNRAVVLDYVSRLNQELGFLEVQAADKCKQDEGESRRHLELAESYYSRAIELTEGENEVVVRPIRSDTAARSLCLRAFLKMRLKRDSEALVDCDSAVIRAVSRDCQTDCQLARIRALTKLGQFEESLDVLDKLSHEIRESTMFDVKTIASYGFLYQLIAEDEGMVVGTKSAFMDLILQRVIALARRGHRKDEQVAPILLEVLQNDDDLVLIRQNPRFQELLRELSQ